jgi:tetratricopeptide (TPR) repeat protein
MEARNDPGAGQVRLIPTRSPNDMIRPNSPEPAATHSANGSLRRLFWAGAALVFFGSFILYARTMEATASFWDSGEFIAAAHILGIPHSPGTPLFVLVAKVASLLPLPFLSIAQRVNLMSAFCGAAGVLFVYALAVRFFDDMAGQSKNIADGLVRVGGALAGALFLAFSDSHWTNSIEAEVYGMSTAFMGFMTWLALKWGDLPKTPRSTSLIYLVFYLLALSVGFHLGTVLVFSGIFVFVLMSKDRPFSTAEWMLASFTLALFVADATIYRNGGLTVFLMVALAGILTWLYSRGRPFAAVCAGLFVLGLSVHLMLYLRSMHNPAIDEGDPETWRNLYAVLRREQYPPTSVTARKAPFLWQLQHFNGYFQAQFQMFATYVGRLNLGSLIPVALGIWGMVDQFAKHRKTFVMLFVTQLVMSLGLIVFLNFSDSEVRERDYFYSPAFYYFAVYIGIGAASVLNEIRGLFARSPRPVIGTAVAAAMVAALPLFTLKQHFFSHDRSDSVLCDEYARNMLVCLEPNAILFTNGDNDTFPLWYIQEVEGYRRDVKVVNLSLLNTPWYIKQCRDNIPEETRLTEGGKFPIVWRDDQIDALTPVPSGDGWLLIRDLAVDHIIRTNRFQRPVYFAVTIPASTFAPYREILEMEGLAYKVVPRRGERMVNVPKLEDCIVNQFKYSGILTPSWTRDGSVFLQPYIVHLIQNYSVAFMELSFAKHQEKNYEAAIRYMLIAQEISPHLDPPRQLLGLYYMDSGDTARAEQHYLDVLKEHPNDFQAMYRLANVYERQGKYAQALEMITPIVADDPEARDLVVTAYTLAARAGMMERAREYLSDWLARHPDDAEARKMLEDFDRTLREGRPSQP